MRPNSLPVEGADLMLQRDGSLPVDAIDMHPVAKGVDVDPMRLRVFDPVELGCRLRRHAPLGESAVIIVSARSRPVLGSPPKRGCASRQPMFCRRRDFRHGLRGSQPARAGVARQRQGSRG